MQSVMAHLARIATEALADGRYDTMGAAMLSVSEANALFEPVDDAEGPSAKLASGAR
jgi:hypothetical protein